MGTRFSIGHINNKRVKFFDSFFIRGLVHQDKKPGTIVVTAPFLGIKTIDGILYFQRIQVEGKTILPVKEALRGFPIHVGDVIKA